MSFFLLHYTLNKLFKYVILIINFRSGHVKQKLLTKQYLICIALISHLWQQLAVLRAVIPAPQRISQEDDIFPVPEKPVL